MNTPMPGSGTEEVLFKSSSGYAALVVMFLSLLAIPMAAFARFPPLLLLAVISFIFIAKGMYMLQPNQSALLMLFGSYRGTDYQTGLRWANPFLNKMKVSLRLRNFNSEKLKVNDKRGNPIEIAAAIVWRVSDTARAVLDIDHYEQYVPVQAEAALRHLANEYSYDHVDEADSTLTLRAGGDEIIGKLKKELQDRFGKAGLLVEDARLTHLAYAPEIAGVMLRRQQAAAVIAARQKIVEGAVGMVEMALEQLGQKQIVQLDEERKASMVSNLMVVLCSEQATQPVVNAGTLYQ